MNRNQNPRHTNSSLELFVPKASRATDPKNGVAKRILDFSVPPIRRKNSFSPLLCHRRRPPPPSAAALRPSPPVLSPLLLRQSKDDWRVGMRAISSAAAQRVGRHSPHIAPRRGRAGVL